MFVPVEARVELTAETAHRLHYGNLFTTFSEADPAAQHQLGANLGLITDKVAFEDLSEADQTMLKSMSLARAFIFFAHDDSQKLGAVPWIRSPQESRFSSHFQMSLEFKRFALDAHEGLKLNRPLDCFPDGFGGMIVPDEDQLTFVGRSKITLPEEHVFAVKDAQRALAKHGIELNVQAGTAVLQASELFF